MFHICIHVSDSSDRLGIFPHGNQDGVFADCEDGDAVAVSGIRPVRVGMRRLQNLFYFGLRRLRDGLAAKPDSGAKKRNLEIFSAGSSLVRGDAGFVHRIHSQRHL